MESRNARIYGRERAGFSPRFGLGFRLLTLPVSYFLVELFSGIGAALAFAKYGWVAAACFMISEVGAILEGELTTEAQSTQRIGMDLSLALG